MFATLEIEKSDITRLYLETFFYYTWRIGFFVFACVSGSFGFSFWGSLSAKSWISYGVIIVGAAAVASALYVFINFLFRFKQVRK